MRSASTVQPLEWVTTIGPNLLAELYLTRGCENTMLTSGFCWCVPLYYPRHYRGSGLAHERCLVLLLFPVFVLGVTIYMVVLCANSVVTANEKKTHSTTS